MGALAINTNREIIQIVNIIISCLLIFICSAYHILFWTIVSGQTPGKMALGIKVISVDGSAITFGRATWRYIGYIVSALVMHLGFFWIGIDEKR